MSAAAVTLVPVFDERQRVETLATLRRRLDAVAGESREAHAGMSVLAVPEPLADVLPGRGLPSGGVISVCAGSSADGAPDAGAMSLLLSLLAAPCGPWVAVVGIPGLGLAAAAELGVDFDRLVVIPDPGPDVLQVLSVLADGVDLIAVAQPAILPPARLRVLSGRLRQRGAVLLVSGRWPGADLVLTVRGLRWFGLGDGHGRLCDRELDVDVTGRRLGGMRSATLMLRATTGTAVTVGRGDRVAAATVAQPVADAV